MGSGEETDGEREQRKHLNYPTKCPLHPHPCQLGEALLGASLSDNKVALASSTGTALEAVGAPRTVTLADRDYWEAGCRGSPVSAPTYPLHPRPQAVAAGAVPPASLGWLQLQSSRCSLAQAGLFQSGLRASSHAPRPLGTGLNRWNNCPEFPSQLHLPPRISLFCCLYFHTRRVLSRVYCQENS